MLVDFWTYTCINCLRTLPYLEAWDARYRRDGLVIVGVHSPEFPFERDAGNVATAIRREGIRYPVAQDNKLATWNAWGNQYWPADYLVDARGQVRGAHFGEGDYDRTEMDIRALLKEAGHPNPGAMADPKGAVHPTRVATPETYLGLARAERFDPPPLRGTHTYAQAPKLATSHFALSGTWDESDVAATARADAAIHAAIVGKDAYLVLSPPPGGTGDVSGAARRPPDRRRSRRRRRPPRRGARRPPAPVPPGLRARRRAPRAHAARRVRNSGVRLHVRIASPDARDGSARAGAAGREGGQRVGRLGPRHARRGAVAARRPAGRTRGAALRRGGCPFQTKAVATHGAGRVSLTRVFRRVRLRVGARLDVRVSDSTGAVVVRFVVRSGRAPRKERTWLSLQPVPAPAPGAPAPGPGSPGSPPPGQGPAATGQRALDVASLYIGTPYAYGGARPETGFDAPGLVQ